ncbi:MAG: BlaI/MecI/CopY family transcriptional regulator [Chthoniobacterales bacterium]
MKREIKISEAEWEVMKVIWRQSPLSALEVADKLNKKPAWHPKTVKTLINRLVKKGVLGYEKVGRIHLFSPRLSESQCVLNESESFLDRIFGGSLQPMVAQLVKHRKLSAADIEELQKILRGKDRK